MKKKLFTKEQIIGILLEQEAGAKATDLARKYGGSETTLYNWTAKFGGRLIPIRHGWSIRLFHASQQFRHGGDFVRFRIRGDLRQHQPLLAAPGADHVQRRLAAGLVE
jgi:hypothetical protein